MSYQPRMNEPTTSYGHVLSDGCEGDINDIPYCCGSDMTSETDDDGDLRYTCDTCDIVVIISPTSPVTIIDW